MKRPPSDIAFTPAVKAEQTKRGSRSNYQRMEEGNGWAQVISPELSVVIAGVRSFYLATANADCQPYIQHRGGPSGFLCVLDERTLAFADYGGNRQYITLGNLTENPRACILLMDYARRLRIKIWGRARVIEDDDALLARVSKVAGGAPERTIVFEIKAWDRNCKQHIPQLLPAEAVEQALRELQDRIAALEAENALLRGT
jgi:predicted pyridoxine 5'-phosphate oxidase superfamily flavin-nucleotide-binding protein